MSAKYESIWATCASIRAALNDAGSDGFELATTSLTEPRPPFESFEAYMSRRDPTIIQIRHPGRGRRDAIERYKSALDRAGIPWEFRAKAWWQKRSSLFVVVDDES